MSPRAKLLLRLRSWSELCSFYGQHGQSWDCLVRMREEAAELIGRGC